MLVETMEPIALPVAQEEQVRALSALLHGESKPRLMVMRGDVSQELPDAVYTLLITVVDHLQNGDAVSVVPVAKTLSTQQTASFLGVSRPFVVKMLQRGELPYYAAGTHRRILLNDLLAYKARRDRSRVEAINQMSREADEADVYDRVLLPAS